MSTSFSELSKMYGPVRSHDRWYVRSKLALDPVYEASYKALADSSLPLLDLGCGMGLFIASLRQKGWRFPAYGLDYDAGKIEKAQMLVQQHPNFFLASCFEHKDLKEGLPEHRGNVAILDILQFFSPQQRRKLLLEAAQRTAKDGCLIIRQTLDNSGKRRGFSKAVDWIARRSGWMKDYASDYPTEKEIVDVFASVGLRGEFRLLSGKLPLENWFAEFRYEASVSAKNLSSIDK